jgi:hypothetical protein
VVEIDREAFNRSFLTVICCEIAAELDDAAKTLRRSVDFGDVETATWSLALIGRAITGPEYTGAVRYLQRLSRRIGEFFERYPVLVSPVTAGPPFRHGALQPPASERAAMAALGALHAARTLRALGALERAAGTVFEWLSFTPVANATGQPAMSVPLSWNAGLPIGALPGPLADEAIFGWRLNWSSRRRGGRKSRTSSKQKTGNRHNRFDQAPLAGRARKTFQHGGHGGQDPTGEFWGALRDPRVKCVAGSRRWWEPVRRATD